MSDRDGAFAEMTALILRHTPREDLIETRIPDFFLFRQNRPGEPQFCSRSPAFALVAQGTKTMALGAETYRYGVGDFLVVSMDLPIFGCVVEASPEHPLLSLGMEIRPERLRQVIERIEPRSLNDNASGLRGIGVNRVSTPLLESVLRYLRLLETPQDIPALAPLMEQEILYRLLTGPYGPRLIQNLTMDSAANRVGRAVDWLRRNYVLPLRMEDLAAHAGMSVSSLHHHFRSMTAMTPMKNESPRVF